MKNKSLLYAIGALLGTFLVTIGLWVLVGLFWWWLYNDIIIDFLKWDLPHQSFMQILIYCFLVRLLIFIIRGK